MTRRARIMSGALALAVLSLGNPATAQVTPEQQSAIRGACRGDFTAKCSSVTPGGPEALACLQKNVAGLSPPCKTAVSATLPAATAPAASKPPAAKPAAAKPAAAKPAAPAAAKPVATKPVPTVAAAPGPGPSEQQMSAVKFTCRSDFSHHCRGVPQGGPEALTCLQSHEATLSQDCKTALADIADFVPAPAASAPVAATTAAPAARMPMPPGITPAGRVVRRVIKREEAR